MITYFLPDPGIYGGIKVGYQFAELLSELGVRTVVASPGGKAPQWFKTSVAVVDEREALRQASGRDHIIFSLPYDYDRLRQTPARLVFHCQGTNPLHDPTFEDPDCLILTCWEQAARYVRENFGRRPIEVGIALSDCFFGSPYLKFSGRVAFMPRRGGETALACLRACPDLVFQPIDQLAEGPVSEIMARSEYYLATAEREWFGLPALEAMAAGCLVLSVPVLGGMDYLRDGDNCLVADPGEMPERLRWIAAPENARLRERIRHRARATAGPYRLSVQRRRLSQLLRSELGELLT